MEQLLFCDSQVDRVSYTFFLFTFFVIEEQSNNIPYTIKVDIEKRPLFLTFVCVCLYVMFVFSRGRTIICCGSRRKHFQFTFGKVRAQLGVAIQSNDIRRSSRYFDILLNRYVFDDLASHSCDCHRFVLLAREMVHHDALIQDAHAIADVDLHDGGGRSDLIAVMMMVTLSMTVKAKTETTGTQR